MATAGDKSEPGQQDAEVSGNATATISLRHCLSCGSPSPDDGVSCRRCGARLRLEPLKPLRRSRSADKVLVGGGFIVVGVVAAIFGTMLAGPQTGAGRSERPSPTAAVRDASVGVSTTIAVLTPSSVAASSESGEHHASHLIDGDVDSVWLSAPGNSAATLTFEFGRDVIFKEIEFVFIDGTEHGSEIRRARRVELDVGSDAAPITLELADGRGPHRFQFAGRVTSNVFIRVLEPLGESAADDGTHIGFAEIRLLGVS